MRRIVAALLFLMAFSASSQNHSIPDFEALDSLYREDQFYFSFTYNVWQRRPDGVRQNKFSSGLSAGFLRDMPINKTRTWAIAAGLGYAINNFNHNIVISRSEDVAEYDLLLPDQQFDKNKIILHYVELPVEVRWRTSTPQSHKFWRVYTGLKLSYLIYDKYKFEDIDGRYTITRNDDLNRLLYGAYLSTGYNTWNFHIYYALNPLFKDAKLSNGHDLKMQTLNVGLMFYIL